MRLAPILAAMAVVATGCYTPARRDAIESREALTDAKRSYRYAQLREKQVKRSLERPNGYRKLRKLQLEKATAAPPKRDGIVAVFDLEDHDGRLDAIAQREISTYMAVAILENTTDRIVPPDRLRQALVDEKTSSYRACYDEACQIELGRSLAANRILESSLFASGDECLLGATLYDLQSETATWSDTVETSCEMAKLYEGVEALARLMAEDAEANR